MALCVFVFGILAFNPMSSLIGQGNSGLSGMVNNKVHDGGRMLFSLEEDAGQFIHSFLVISFINFHHK